MEKSFDSDGLYCEIMKQLNSIDRVLREKQSLAEKLNNEREENQEINKKVRELKKKVKSERKRNKKIKNYKSYKIGRIITALPRKIKQLF